MTRTSIIRLIRLSLLGLLMLFVVGYAVSRSVNYARGPKITLFEPINGSTIATSTITIRGRVDRINNLLLNGNPFSINEAGDFNQTVIVFNGLNIFTLSAHDQFGRGTETELRIFGTVNLPTSTPSTKKLAPQASSTTPNSPIKTDGQATSSLQ